MKEVFIDGIRYVPAPPVPTGDVFARALEIRMVRSDLGAVTIREYLHKLLSTLWEKEESFSGKRPFGNSSWSFDLMYSLVYGKAIPGEIEIDEDGYVQDCTCDKKEAFQYISDLIDYCFFGKES